MSKANAAEAAEQRAAEQQRLLDRAAELLHNSGSPRDAGWHDRFDEWLADNRAALGAGVTDTPTNEEARYCENCGAAQRAKTEHVKDGRRGWKCVRCRRWNWIDHQGREPEGHGAAWVAGLKYGAQPETPTNEEPEAVYKRAREGSRHHRCPECGEYCWPLRYERDTLSERLEDTETCRDAWIIKHGELTERLQAAERLNSMRLEQWAAWVRDRNVARAEAAEQRVAELEREQDAHWPEWVARAQRAEARVAQLEEALRIAVEDDLCEDVEKYLTAARAALEAKERE